MDSIPSSLTEGIDIANLEKFQNAFIFFENLGQLLGGAAHMCAPRCNFTYTNLEVEFRRKRVPAVPHRRWGRRCSAPCRPSAADSWIADRDDGWSGCTGSLQKQWPEM